MTDNTPSTDRLTLATSFDVSDGKVRLYDKDGNYIEGKNAYWKGDFNAESRGITTFEGMPAVLIGDAYLSWNLITSFQHCPEGIHKLDLNGNEITSFQHCPEGIHRLYLSGNRITSFRHCPEGIHALDMEDNEITSFQHCPEGIHTLYLSYNQISSFQHCPEGIHKLYLDGNKISSFQHCPEGTPMLYLSWNQFTSFQHCPEGIHELDLEDNQITSFRHCPEGIHTLHLNGNGITSFQHCPEGIHKLYLYGNEITSLQYCPEGIPMLYLYRNKITSIQHAPKLFGKIYCNHCIPDHPNKFEEFLKRGVVYADGIATKLISQKGNVFKTRDYDSNKVVYVIRDGDYFAHGDTIKQARESLLFKKADRDVSAHQDIPFDTVKSPVEWAAIYHAVTGACEAGCRMFMEKQEKLKKKYTLKEILEITKGAYGYAQFLQTTTGEK